MWRMLCDATRAKGRDAWKLDAAASRPMPRPGAHTGGALPFQRDGRMVHNVIEAQFTFTDGLIATPATASTYGAGHARLSARPGWRWAGRRCCATRYAPSRVQARAFMSKPGRNELFPRRRRAGMEFCPHCALKLAADPTASAQVQAIVGTAPTPRHERTHRCPTSTTAVFRTGRANPNAEGPRSRPGTRFGAHRGVLLLATIGTVVKRRPHHRRHSRAVVGARSSRGAGIQGESRGHVQVMER